MPLILPFCVAGIIWQQPPAEPSQPLYNLTQALDSLAWDVSKRGPLLIVGADKTQIPNVQTRMQSQTGPKVPPPNTPIKTVADLFELRVEQVGTLHVLVPQKVKRFLGPPDTDPESVTTPMERHELAQELGYSMTKDQWAALSSPRGLGLDNLNPKQQALYLQLLPDPIRIQPTQTRSDQNGPQLTELTPDQRAQVRLKMDRKTTLTFMTENRTFGGVSFGDAPGEKQRTFYLMGGEENRKEPFYEQIAPLVPNKPRPGDLDFDAALLDASLPFADAKTAEDLMKRLREVTGLKIVFADARIGALSVKIWGESARAGDVLRALCRNIGGAVRKVGEGSSALYVLTDDRVGLGTRLAAFSEWRNAASSNRWKDDEKRRKPLEGIDFAGMTPLDNSFGLSPDLLKDVDRKRYQYSYPDTDKPDSRGVAVSSLSPALQSFVEKKLGENPTFKFYDGSGEQEQALRRDRVDVQSSYRLQMTIPGWGDTDAYDLWGLMNIPQSVEMMRYFKENPPKPPPPKPLRYPATWKVRGLVLRPKDPAESRALAKLAKQNGFNVLWVEVPLDAKAARPILEAALSEKLPVVALAHVLQVPARAIPPGTRPDISILGETSDLATERQRLRNLRMNPNYPFPAPPEPLVYLDPTPATQKRQIEQAVALAKIPGLTGLALKSVTPPGYEVSANQFYFSGVPGLGYSLENRLAFLLKESIDPIDLAPEYTDSRLVASIFSNDGPNYIQLASGQYGPDPSYRDRKKLWRELLGSRIAGLKKELYTRLKTSNPGQPLWISPDEATGYGNFYCIWEKPDAKLATAGNPWEPKSQLARAKSFSSQALTQLGLPWRDEKKKLDVTNWRNGILETAKVVGPGGFTWSGFLVDATATPSDQLAELLPLFKEDPP
jgi:hypothetical protein